MGNGIASRYLAGAAVAVRRWLAPRTSPLAAALAFQALLALAPLLLLLTAAAGPLLGRQTTREMLLEATGRVAGADAERIADAMVQMVAVPRWRTTGTLLGAVLLIHFASAFFVQLRRALDIIWEVEPAGFRRALLLRLVSLAETLAAVAVALFLLALGVLRSMVWPLLASPEEPGGRALGALTHLGSFLWTVMILAAAYHYLPEVRPRPTGRAALAAAVPAALLFSAGSHLLGRVIAHSALASLYGAAGSVIVALLWMYYCAWIVLLGAELCRAWDGRHGDASDDA